MNSLFCLKPTPYGGRGFYAIKPIPRDTLLLTCEAPYVNVISRKFRKEVCGQCFAYAFDCGRNAWNIRYSSQEPSGVWFCSEACRDLWDTEQNVDDLQVLMNVAVDKAAKTKKRPEVEGPSFVETLKPEDITLDVHERVWKRAVEKYSRPGCPVPDLDELELDAARFVVNAMIRRYREEAAPALSRNPSLSTDALVGWKEFLRLQNNEFPYIRQRPYMLESHTRIYGFLRKACLPNLQAYVSTPEMVRAILGRDQGNAFGLWDMSTKGDSEMLGWSVYVVGSYFNHDCTPNVRRVRNKRALCFYACRDVDVGEELCISYVNIGDRVQERRADLLASWYFECVCKRCEVELRSVHDSLRSTRAAS